MAKDNASLQLNPQTRVRVVGIVSIGLALTGAVLGLFLASRDKSRQENEARMYRMQGQFDAGLMTRQVIDLQQEVEKSTASINAITLAMKS